MVAIVKSLLWDGLKWTGKFATPTDQKQGKEGIMVDWEETNMEN